MLEWLRRLFASDAAAEVRRGKGGPPPRARAEDIVGARHVGAWIDNEREEDPLELPGLLLALTDGELGNVNVERGEDDEGRCLILRSSLPDSRGGRRSWRVPFEPPPRPLGRPPQDEGPANDFVYMVDLAHVINVALRDVGAAARLYNLQDGHFAYATSDQVEELARAGILAEEYELPAERVRQWPLSPGTTGTFHGNGRLATGTLAEVRAIDGIPCAPGAISFDVDGTLRSAALAAPHRFGGVELPPGSHVTLWTPDHPEEATIPTAIVVDGLSLPPGSTLHFYEAGGLAGAYLATETFFDGGRLDEGERLDHEPGAGWREAERWPLWRPSTEPDTLDDPDVTSVAELERFYPAPPGFAYELVDGRIMVRRIADGGLFGISLEGEILCFWEKRFDERLGREIANNFEVEKRPPDRP